MIYGTHLLEESSLHVFNTSDNYSSIRRVPMQIAMQHLEGVTLKNLRPKKIEEKKVYYMTNVPVYHH